MLVQLETIMTIDVQHADEIMTGIWGGFKDFYLKTNNFSLRLLPLKLLRRHFHIAQNLLAYGNIFRQGCKDYDTLLNLSTSILVGPVSVRFFCHV